MPISHGDQLIELMRSLTKAEKRNFRLYARRIQGEGDAKFLQLFDLLEKQGEYDEAAIRRQLPGATSGQFSNLKRHLYQHILTSLRLIQLNKNEAIQIRESIDYAQILYGKGLYFQSLKLLNRAKTMAGNLNLDFLHAEIIEFEKRIESRHITRSTTERMIDLTREAGIRSSINHTVVQLSNLKLLLQRRFINHGHISDVREKVEVEQYFQKHFPPVNVAELSFFEKIYYYQAYFWYSYLLLDFRQCLYWTTEWVGLYREAPQMIDLDVDMYMRAGHYQMTTAFLLREREPLARQLETLEEFRDAYSSKLNPNSKILAFLVVHQGRFNRCFLEGAFDQALPLIPRTLRRIKRYGNQVDTHKIFILYFKIAWTYLMNHQPARAVDYLNLILNHPGKPLREDIQGYTHLMLLMAHYDLHNQELMDFLLKRADRYLQSTREVSALQKAALRFFRQLNQKPPSEHPGLTRKFARELESLRHRPEELRSFIFLDLPAWLNRK